MNTILRIRDKCKEIYADYGSYLVPCLKLLFALCALLSVNAYLGQLAVLCRLPVVLICALICAVTPPGVTAFFCAAFAVGHISEISLVAAAVLLCWSLLCVGLYLGFRPRGALILVLVPLCFLWKIPFLCPIVLGLAAGAGAAVPCVFALPAWFLIRYTHLHAYELNNSTDLSVMMESFQAVLTGVFRDRYLYLMLLMFVAVILLVSLLKRLPIAHAWTIAVVMGAAAELLIGVAGGQITGGGDLLTDLAGFLLSLILALCYEMLFFAVDYRATQKLQFEDDDYYYYVKAVPKLRAYEDDERRE